MSVNDVPLDLAIKAFCQGDHARALKSLGAFLATQSAHKYNEHHAHIEHALRHWSDVAKNGKSYTPTQLPRAIDDVLATVERAMAAVSDGNGILESVDFHDGEFFYIDLLLQSRDHLVQLTDEGLIVRHRLMLVDIYWHILSTPPKTTQDRDCLLDMICHIRSQMQSFTYMADRIRTLGKIHDMAMSMWQ